MRTTLAQVALRQWLCVETLAVVLVVVGLVGVGLGLVAVVQARRSFRAEVRRQLEVTGSDLVEEL